jgi:D-arabinose 1-dehydrogenase-like Zn-dependent alcohol dehydrogenase
MLAAVLKAFNQLALEDVPKPEPGPGEVLVRIKACGICATDYKAIKGIRTNVEFPLIPGHEPAGVIAAVGAFVQNTKEGDEVIISPSGFCGVCRNCRLGMTHYCEHAYTTGGDGYHARPGSFAEYTITGASNVSPSPQTSASMRLARRNRLVEHGKGWFTTRRFAWGTMWC